MFTHRLLGQGCTPVFHLDQWYPAFTAPPFASFCVHALLCVSKSISGRQGMKVAWLQCEGLTLFFSFFFFSFPPCHEVRWRWMAVQAWWRKNKWQWEMGCFLLEELKECISFACEHLCNILARALGTFCSSRYQKQRDFCLFWIVCTPSGLSNSQPRSGSVGCQGTQRMLQLYPPALHLTSEVWMEDKCGWCAWGSSQVIRRTSWVVP